MLSTVLATFAEIVPKLTNENAPAIVLEPSSRPPAATVLSLVIVRPGWITSSVEPEVTMTVMRDFPEVHGDTGICRATWRHELRLTSIEKQDLFRSYTVILVKKCINAVSCICFVLA